MPCNDTKTLTALFQAGDAQLIRAFYSPFFLFPIIPVFDLLQYWFGVV